MGCLAGILWNVVDVMGIEYQWEMNIVMEY